MSHKEKIKETKEEEDPHKGFFDGTWSLPNESPYKGTVEKEPVYVQSEIDVVELEKFMEMDSE